MFHNRWIRISISIFFWSGITFFVAKSLQTLPSVSEIVTAVYSTNNPSFLLFAAFFFIVAMILRGARFYFLMNSHLPVKLTDSLCIYFWSFLVGAITPMRVGEGLRIAWARSEGMNMGNAANLWVLERLSDLVILAVITTCLFMTALNVISFEMALLISVCIIVCYVALIYFLNAHGFKAEIYLFKWLFKIIKRSEVKHLSNLDIGVFFLCTFFIWTSMVFVFYFAYGAYIVNLNFMIVILLLGIVNLSFLLALLPGNVVGYQMAAIFTLSLYGIPIETALSPAIVAHFLTYCIIFFLGVISRVILLKHYIR